MACGDWLVIWCGPLVYCCDRRNFEDQPFRVLYTYRADSVVLRTSFLFRHLLVCTEELDDSVCTSRIRLLDPKVCSMTVNNTNKTRRRRRGRRRRRRKQGEKG